MMSRSGNPANQTTCDVRRMKVRSAHTRFCTRTLMETAAITSSQHCMHLCCTTGSTTQGQSVDPELSCTLCHKAQDSADMLVCDECHHGMHMGPQQVCCWCRRLFCCQTILLWAASRPPCADHWVLPPAPQAPSDSVTAPAQHVA